MGYHRSGGREGVGAGGISGKKSRGICVDE